MSMVNSERQFVGGQQLSPQRIAAREEELRLIREEHERLGRRLHWLGRTVAEQVGRMDADLGSGSTYRLLCKVTNDSNAYRQAAWWKKVFIWVGRIFSVIRRKQEYRLLLYAGARDYLAADLHSENVAENHQQLFLPQLLKQPDYGVRWRRRFIDDDKLRSRNKKEGEAKARAVKVVQELKQLVEHQKQLIGSMLERLKKGRALLKIGEFNKAVESQLTTQELANVVSLGASIERLGIKALNTAASCRRLVDVCIGKFDDLHGEAGSEVERLKQEALQLVGEVDLIMTQMRSQGRHLKDEGLALARNVRKLTRARAKESTRRAEAMRQLSKESRKRMLAAQREGVHRLERRALELDKWERELQGMTKRQRCRHLRTEADIAWMWGAIFRDAYRAGIWHLVPKSLVFNCLAVQSPIAKPIFNTYLKWVLAEQQKTIHQLERRAFELDKWERGLQGMTKRQRFGCVRTDADIARGWRKIFVDARRGRVIHLVPKSLVLNCLALQSRVGHSIFNMYRPYFNMYLRSGLPRQDTRKGPSRGFH